MKHSFKLALMATFLGATILTSACSPVKPPHKQTFEKFTERRAPRDNSAMANGNFDPSSEKKTAFVPYNGTINVSNPTTAVDAKSKAGMVIEQNSGGAQSSDAQSTKKSDQQNKSLLERLLSKLDMSEEKEVIQVAQNTERKPFKQTLSSNYNFGEGSSPGQNIYEVSEEIIPAQPVAKIETGSLEPIKEKAVVMLAQTKPITQGTVYNPSAPLVEVPEVPSKDEMNKKAEQVTKEPELKDIPSTPEKFKDAPPKKPEIKEIKKENLVIPNEIKKNEPVKSDIKDTQPKAKAMPKNEMPVKKKVTAYDFNIGMKKPDVQINDPRARMMKSHGVDVVSGELGNAQKSN